MLLPFIHHWIIRSPLCHHQAAVGLQPHQLYGLEKVGGEHALIEKLKNFKHPCMKDGCFVFFRVNFKPTSALLFFQQEMAV